MKILEASKNAILQAASIGEHYRGTEGQQFFSCMYVDLKNPQLRPVSAE